MLAQVFPEALGIVFDHDVPDAGTRRQRRPPRRDAWKVVKDRLRHRGIDDGEVAEERGVDRIDHAEGCAGEIRSRAELRLQSLESVAERCPLGGRAGSVALRNCQASERVGVANSIHARCRARSSASSEYIAAPPCVSSIYSQITMLSKRIASSPSIRRTLSSGTLAVGDSARNQSGLAERSTLIRSNGTPFSRRTIAARWTNGQSGWLTSVRLRSGMMASRFQMKERREDQIA